MNTVLAISIKRPQFIGKDANKNSKKNKENIKIIIKILFFNKTAFYFLLDIKHCICGGVLYFWPT